MKKRKLLLPVIAIMFSILFVQCSDDDDDTGTMDEKGTLAVKVTDAPSDDSNIQGTFVTVADIKVDGESLEGFTKQTVEISAYQNGNAKLIFNDEIEADSYNSLTLVLDYESDASGNAPGCYVLTDDNMKHNLTASSSMDSEITLSKSFNVQSNSETALVVDFDLRRAVTRDDESAESDYMFVSKTELQSAVRIVKEDEAGEISGKVDALVETGDETYVFLYHKGTFNSMSETQGQGASNILFANAVSSAKVESDGSYTLPFLEEGDYEVHVASYTESSVFSTILQGLLNASSKISGLFLNDISVSSNTELELNIEVNGLM